MSFIEITQSQVALPDRGPSTRRKKSLTRETSEGAEEDEEDHGMSKEVNKTENLFSTLSSHSDIDHPICAECTSMLLTAFNARLGSANRERDAYASFFKSVQQTNSSTPRGGGSVAQKETSDARNAGRSIYSDLERTEAESQKLEEDIVKLEEEMQKVHLEEKAYWAWRNSFDDSLHQTSVRLSSLRERYTHDRQQLERLQRTNVYNDTFCIGHDGYFGTINGLRLGRLPNQNVDWGEINAAWGQTLLLLATVAERLRYQFQAYRLKPQGSTSRIEKLEYPQQAPGTARQSIPSQDRGLNSAAANPEPKITPLDLFSSGDMAIGRLLNHRRFDAGMVAFLDCLGQLGKYVENTSSLDPDKKAGPNRNAPLRHAPPNRVLPYSIEGDKIGNISIKLGVGFHQDENFTKACKYALTCCKFLLAHVSNIEVNKAV